MGSATRAACFFGLVTMAQAGCGAWEFHQAGIPIDKVPPPPQCKANPNCPPNDGNCCPTPGKGGSMLDCCNTFSCDCKSHPQCVNENKTGTCCPNDKGVYDPCCSNFQAAVNNPACEKAGVKGNACPDDKGKFHECCHSDAKCSYKNQCPGLAGDCCPTPGGMTLGCCLNKGSEMGLAAAPLELVSAPNCTDKACLDDWRKTTEAQYKNIPEAYRHYATDPVEAAYKKALAELTSTSSAPQDPAPAPAPAPPPAPAPAHGSDLAQLAAVGMPAAGAAFFVVFVVGVAIGARFGRSSTQKDEYHVMG